MSDLPQRATPLPVPGRPQARLAAFGSGVLLAVSGIWHGQLAWKVFGQMLGLHDVLQFARVAGLGLLTVALMPWLGKLGRRGVPGWVFLVGYWGWMVTQWLGVPPWTWTGPPGSEILALGTGALFAGLRTGRWVPVVWIAIAAMLVEPVFHWLPIQDFVPLGSVFGVPIAVGMVLALWAARTERADERPALEEGAEGPA